MLALPPGPLPRGVHDPNVLLLQGSALEPSISAFTGTQSRAYRARWTWTQNSRCCSWGIRLSPRCLLTGQHRFFFPPERKASSPTACYLPSTAFGLLRAPHCLRLTPSEETSVSLCPTMCLTTGRQGCIAMDPPGRPAYAQPRSSWRQVPASMVFVTDSNRPPTALATSSNRLSSRV